MSARDHAPSGTQARAGAIASECELPTRHGSFRLRVFAEEGVEHLVLSMGNPAADPAPLVRVHSECLTGEVLGSLRCDCGAQLDAAMSAIAEAGSGALVYLRQEGRGIGLTEKIRAYALQDEGLDTVEANLQLGFAADQRDYGPAQRILAQLGVSRLRLMTNNPAKLRALTRLGIEVTERVPIVSDPQAHNRGYLEAKRDRMGHLFDWVDGTEEGGA